MSTSITISSMWPSNIGRRYLAVNPDQRIFVTCHGVEVVNLKRIRCFNSECVSDLLGSPMLELRRTIR